ncbi:hypothetical protein F4679DRAFT_354257 [Xylaria curta]|nr:hypothetical protein F4679DRAFT_354257 [Xylaria curta]
MDALESTPIASEDGHVANAPSHPTSQYFDESLFFSEQPGNDSPAQRNSQAGMEQHEMESLSQSKDNMQTSRVNYSGQAGTRTQNRSMSLNMPDTISSVSTPAFNFNDGASITADFNFIEVWIASVAQHTFYPSEGKGIPLIAEPDATLTDSTNDDQVIDKNKKLEECPVHEDPHNNSALHQEQRRIKNMLAQQARRRNKRQRRRDFEETCDSTWSCAALASDCISFGPRKGRRVAFRGKQDNLQLINDSSSAVVGSVARPGETPARTVVYPCTFCRKKFSAPYIWKRHEASAHAPQFQWVCGLDMPIEPKGRTVCPICATAAQSGGDFVACAHRFDECWEKPRFQRAFFRKDTLKQHIRVFHCKGDSTLPFDNGIDLNRWREEITKYDLTCYFCGFSCRTWNDRTSHLIKHFNNKIPMNLWIPRGPYAITYTWIPYNNATCRLPVSEIANGNARWRCPLNVFDFATTLVIGTRNAYTWECNLCGSLTNLNRDEILHHLNIVHSLDRNPCQLTLLVFSDATKFVEHLITNHEARRGNWMAALLHTALQKTSHTDELLQLSHVFRTKLCE